MASVLKWNNRRITIDQSGHVANAIFLRFEREFEGTASCEEIATTLRADEEAVFEMLGVREEGK